jgi:hypothetical protein
VGDLRGGLGHGRVDVDGGGEVGHQK